MMLQTSHDAKVNEKERLFPVIIYSQILPTCFWVICK